jgi:hypothetical protein
MTWNAILGLISTISLFLPVVLILTMRLGTYKSFPALVVYYLFVFIYNVLTEGYVRANYDVIHYLGIGNNVIDAPLMLFFLTYFSASPAFTRKMHVLIISLLAFSAAMILWKGFSIDSITIILAPGLVVVFAFCCYFFIRQTRISILQRKSTGKALIAAALLFAYGCYGLIYLMYYVFKTKEIADTFLVYYLVTIFSSLLLSAGIIIEKKRVQKLEELKVTRKELSIIYKDTKISSDRFN